MIKCSTEYYSGRRVGEFLGRGLLVLLPLFSAVAPCEVDSCWNIATLD